MGMLDTLWNAQRDPEYVKRLNAAAYLENLWRRRREAVFIYELFGEETPTLLYYVGEFEKKGEKWPTEVLGKLPDNDEDIWKLIKKYPVPRC